MLVRSVQFEAFSKQTYSPEDPEGTSGSLGWFQGVTVSYQAQGDLSRSTSSVPHVVPEHLPD